jgi:ADP-ribose pyrophosphatase
MEHNPWKTKKSELMYESAWIKVTKHEVLNPADKPAIYSTVHFKNLAIGILALDSQNNTWLVGQWRYPIDQYSWEIPEGGGKLDVDPLDSAKRELKEETGIIAKNFREIMRMHLSNSVSDELAIVYLATDLTFEEAEPEESEVLQIKKINIEEAYKWVMEGKITDAITVAAILKTKIMIQEGSV